MTYRKKLIDVSIPLDIINAACRPETENPFLKGHTRSLHNWWARLPLVAARGMLFVSLIDDPSEKETSPRYLSAIDGLPSPYPLPLDWSEKRIEDQRRERLFTFIERLVQWENSNDQQTIDLARSLIRFSNEGELPRIVDPFCGRGTIPFEAQRLGLKAHASDLNPVAVLITRGLIEIPPRFHNTPPVNPESRTGTGGSAVWKGSAGLAEDVRQYGKWIQDQALSKIGYLYPKAPSGETVIAWLWARTVKCPNPACGGDMPLVRSFWLSTKKGREVFVVPTVNACTRVVSFDINRGAGTPREGSKAGRDIQCLICDASVTEKQLREQASRYGYGDQLMAVVTEGQRRRNYYPPDGIGVSEIEAPDFDGLSAPLPKNPRWFSPPAYGLTTFASLFTNRQLIALTTFSDLVGEARELAHKNAIQAGMLDDDVGIADGGDGARAYSDAVAMYLAFAQSRLTDYHSTICTWNPTNENVRNVFVRQAIPMTWDYAESNPVNGKLSFSVAAEWVASAIDALPPFDVVGGTAVQLNAREALPVSTPSLVSTDPPYYDNIGYADLSDYFYLWLRRSLRGIGFSELATIQTPKDQELVATPYRFKGGKAEAEQSFREGFSSTFKRIHELAHPDFPTTVYYAYKQQEEKSQGAIASTGWETMLDGLIKAGFSISGTWPIRTTKGARDVARNTNALASAIVLVCRPRASDAPIATLREFNTTLSAELSPALTNMITGHIAPVDLAQSVIGPGMSVFSRYSRVIEPDGSEMTVRRALQLINHAVDSYMAERGVSMDRDTQFCVGWFEENRFEEGPYGRADVLARAKDVGVDALARGGVLTSRQGKVQLLDLKYYINQVESYDPTQDLRISVWEACHYLAAAIAPPSGSEELAGRLARQMGGLANDARDLAYRLYSICEQNGWSEEGQPYNLLGDSWSAIQASAAKLAEETQGGLGF